MSSPIGSSSSTRSRRRPPTSGAEQVAGASRWPPAAGIQSKPLAACDPPGPGGAKAPAAAAQFASNRTRNNKAKDWGRGRGRRRAFEFQLARWLALALLLRESLPHLAAVQWSEPRTPPQLTPLASLQRHFQTETHQAESAKAAAAATLNNLINWPLEARAGDRLASMFVSLFAFPLCRANELAGSRPARDKGGEGGRGRGGAPPVPKGVAGSGHEASRTLVVAANVATATYETGGEPSGDEQTEIPINLPATRGTTWDRTARPPSPPLSLKLEQLLESGQNNSNNNNNNETGAFAPAEPNGRPQRPGRPASGRPASDANWEHLARTSRTGAAPASAHAGLGQTYDPNLAPTQLAGVKTRRETANLTMTMTGVGEQVQGMHMASEAARHRRRRSGPDETGELKRRASTTTTTSRRQQLESAARQRDAGDKSGRPMNSVVCNSRCQCVQLEFASELGDNDGERSGPTTSQPKECPSSNSSSSANSNSSSKGPAKCDGDDGAAGELGRADEQSGGNRIALIEFSQDYSFDDDEPDERRASGPGDSSDSDAAELQPTSGVTSPTTTTTTTANTTTTGNGPDEQRPRRQHHDGAPGPTAGASPSSSSSLAAAAAAAAAAASDVDRAAGHQNATIRPDDQSKVVTASEASGDEHEERRVEPTALKAAKPPQAAAAATAMLSIKDNKIGVPTRPAATLAPVVHSEAPATDKAARAKGPPAYQKVASFYPFLTDLHHLRQRHQLPDHQIGPHATGLPGAGPNSLAFLAESKSKPLEADELDLEQLRPIRRILPLRTRSINDTKLNEPAEWAHLIEDIKRRQLQSISLRSSGLKFELWTEIYGLLSVELRQNLIHLDLSRNELVKLGVTFTGYIEHHLAFQLLANQNQLWPFSSAGQHPTAAPVTTTTTTTTTTSGSIANGSSPLGHEQTVASSTSSGRRSQARHPNLGSGELFNQVRSRLPIESGSLLLAAKSSNATDTSKQQLNRLAQKFRQQQHQLAQQTPTILHQAARLKALDLSHNKLRWLINDQFRVLKHVESIRLDHNQIRFIHQQAFNGLEALKYLNLNQNRLQTIYIEQFQTNYNLLALSIKSNHLTFLRAGSLASQNRLKRLDLSKNKFTFLSNNAFVGLDSLRLLNLSSNQFVHVPSTSFHSLAATLEELDMSRNLLTQLAPGTFFHLNLQRILLENNDQLVAIDRGAFWDLPHLSQLSLKSNQMLTNVNAQAFVGLPELQVVNYDDCQQLDGDTKQMLANLTSSPTTNTKLHHPRHEHNNLDGPTMSPMMLASSGRRQLHGEALRGGLSQVANIDEEPLRGARWTMKYVYSMGCVVFVVIVLKLLFKYTSTRHYLDTRRRRRRIYQTTTMTEASNPSTLSSSSMTQSNSSLSERTGGGEDDDDQAESNSALSLNDCDDNLEDHNKCNSFAMCELRPGCDNASNNPGDDMDTDSTGPAEMVEPIQGEEDNVMGTSGQECDVEFGLEQKQEQPTGFETCPDCCNAPADADHQLGLQMGDPNGQAQVCDNTSGTNLEGAQLDLATHDDQCQIAMDGNTQLVCNHEHCNGAYEPFAGNTNQSVPTPAISQLASHWANQGADCGLFRCVCSRCVGADLVGVNGYI